jgi:hypothetical protein
VIFLEVLGAKNRPVFSPTNSPVAGIIWSQGHVRASPGAPDHRGLEPCCH